MSHVTVCDSLEPLTHRQNVASLSLAQLVPLPNSQGRSTRYSGRLHDFSVTIPRCYKDVYTLELSGCRMLSFDL